MVNEGTTFHEGRSGRILQNFMMILVGTSMFLLSYGRVF